MAATDKRSRAARAVFFAFIIFAVAAVLAAAFTGALYGAQAIYHLAGGQ